MFLIMKRLLLKRLDTMLRHHWVMLDPLGKPACGMKAVVFKQ
jgi:hypothetical protein